MDILGLIKSQVEEAISINNKIVGLESVITHIERAEHYLNKGKDNNDDHLFTDVIYRTNHAFEGILKEAYTVLTGKEASKKTPNDIEKYFLTNNILNERVVELLKNYRQEWRNTSTHDYNLFFNHSEAFLAIVSVSAFIHVLLNQVLDKVHFENEKEKLKSTLTTIKKKLNKDYQKLSFIDKVSAIIQTFEDSNIQAPKEEGHHGIMRFAREVESGIAAYVKSLDKSIEVQIEPVLDIDGRRLRPDLILKSKSGEQVIVEIKISRHANRRRMSSMSESQLLTYMSYSGIYNGILLYVPYDLNPETEFVKESKNISVGGANLTMVNIYQKE